MDSRPLKVVVASASWLWGPGNLMHGCLTLLSIPFSLPLFISRLTGFFAPPGTWDCFLPLYPDNTCLDCTFCSGPTSEVVILLAQHPQPVPSLPRSAPLSLLHLYPQYVTYLVLFLSVWFFSTCQNEVSQRPEPQTQNKSKPEYVSISKQLSCTVESWLQ